MINMEEGKCLISLFEYEQTSAKLDKFHIKFSQMVLRAINKILHHMDKEPNPIKKLPIP